MIVVVLMGAWAYIEGSWGLGSNLSLPVFDFCDLGILSPLPCQVFHLSLVEEAGGEG